MGCASSQIETEEAVKRHKARKQYIKQAVVHRHAFAAAHASYTKALKSAGAAIRQFAEVEVPPDGAPTATSVPRQVLHTVSNLLPPPQPPKDPFLVAPRTPLPRAASMPPIAIMSLGGSPSKSSLPSHPPDLSEEEEELFQDQGYPQHKLAHSEPLFGDPFDNIPGTSTFDAEGFELKDLPGAEGSGDLDDEVVQKDEEHYQGPALQVKKGIEDKVGFEPGPIRKQPQMPVQQKTAGRSDKSFGAILCSLDDLFLESYDAGREVSQLLEAQRDYHHIPYVDERSGIKEHNKKVSDILTWTKSSSTSDETDKDKDKDKINLASTLDRLHAWEKKLYDEVKAAEATRLELDRRSVQLKSQKDRQVASAAIEKTKAVVKSLQTRYLVEFEAVDAAISEAQKLRDDYLYPQLMGLLRALRKMWKVMHTCHERQAPMVEELENMTAPSTKETSDFCKKITEDLEREVKLWHDSLERVVMFQKKCVMALLEWLQLNAKQAESEAVENLAATSQQAVIPLHDLCEAWADAVNNLSAVRVLQDLEKFSSTLQDVATKQAEEIKQKRRKEDLHKELEKKKKALETFESKFKEKASSKGVPQGNQESLRHPLQERRALVDLLEKNFAEEEQRHAKLCEENSTIIFQSLKDGLPDVVKSIRDFAKECVEQYNRVKLE
eukprot:c16984_g1_i1 orf=504-2501(-)